MYTLFISFSLSLSLPPLSVLLTGHSFISLTLSLSLSTLFTSLYSFCLSPPPPVYSFCYSLILPTLFNSLLFLLISLSLSVLMKFSPMKSLDFKHDRPTRLPLSGDVVTSAQAMAAVTPHPESANLGNRNSTTENIYEFPWISFRSVTSSFKCPQ